DHVARQLERRGWLRHLRRRHGLQRLRLAIAGIHLPRARGSQQHVVPGYYRLVAILLLRGSNARWWRGRSLCCGACGLLISTAEAEPPSVGRSECSARTVNDAPPRSADNSPKALV